ncbi:MAG: (d)CMP kinase [Alphaproteobacteria bacterium]|nr:(d)CMP kinase [Alphaproteobacteria bacterium]
MPAETLPIIAIDGPAAAGKGTLARALADALGFAFMDTGALYRATAFEVLQAGGDPAAETDALAGALSLTRKAVLAENLSDILENPEFRSDSVAQAASKVAASPAVRAALLDFQRAFAARPGPGFKGAVLDGRDIGTVVCPQADLKIFVTASAEIRAQRRTKELQSRGMPATYEAVLKDMRERDVRDASRSAAPLKPADDAVTVDTSQLAPRETLEKALALVKERLARI